MVPEYLPKWATKVDEKDLDNLIRKLKFEVKINVINASFLINLKSKYPMYLLSESHWTDIAAFLFIKN
jgi:hypothetical protein